MNPSDFPVRVLVCGGRAFSDMTLLASWLNTATQDAQRHEILIIHGAASGADTQANVLAKISGVAVLPFPAVWDDLSHPHAVVCVRRDGTRYDRTAGTRRNQRMLNEAKPTICVAMPGGTGTADMVRRAKQAGVKVIGPEH